MRGPASPPFAPECPLDPDQEETTMKATYLIPAIAGAFLFTTAAFAATGEYDNMCTMGLALDKKVETDCSVNAEIDGKTYCFGNEEAKTLFMKDPEGNLAKAESFYNDNQ
ncbi:hypothetical protein AUC71_07190 [Methyloceanibacter marginalis]|jgi:YHS domain-containing protein|uniref:Uncharacterized protein n=2 Tax=Methyloceanibacter marginalis TaxID=1774971 RepID=A0A1E3WDQ9_9HYPH|nr:hypothetical protein AUC71_07190 [Methyloceanibacter marginalis]